MDKVTDITRNPEAIWLSPICDETAHHAEGRTWAAPAPAGTCEDCPEPWVRYVREDLSTPSPDSGERMREAYLVWSNEHQAWWGKDRCGYTRFIDRAGRYNRAEALSIAGTRDGGWHVRKGNPDEIAIPERDAIDQYASITQSQQEAALQESAR